MKSALCMYTLRGVSEVLRHVAFRHQGNRSSQNVAPLESSLPPAQLPGSSEMYKLQSVAVRLSSGHPRKPNSSRYNKRFAMCVSGVLGA